MSSLLSPSKPKDDGARRWKILSLGVALPGLVLLWFKTFYMEPCVHHEPPKFIAYPHLRLRTKKFPWGDGNHTLFHNPHMNPLPDGYEEERPLEEDA